MTAERIRPRDPLLLINPAFLFLLACPDIIGAATEAEESEDVELQPQEAKEEEAGQTTTNNLTAAAGATAGALGAAFYGGNVLKGALIGAAVSMALVAAMYGAMKAIRAAKGGGKIITKTKAGAKVENVEDALDTKLSPAQRGRQATEVLDKMLDNPWVESKVGDMSNVSPKDIFDIRYQDSIPSKNLRYNPETGLFEGARAYGDGAFGATAIYAPGGNLTKAHIGISHRNFLKLNKTQLIGGYQANLVDTVAHEIVETLVGSDTSAAYRSAHRNLVNWFGRQ